MKHAIFNYFHFSRAERNGAITLFLLCTAVFLAPELASRFYRQGVSDFSVFSAAVEAFHEKTAASGTTAGQVFFFDPNTASFEEFVRLGLPERVARSICNYRDKGGQFRRAEDFGKIYNLPKSDFDRLRPFIRLAGETAKPAGPPQSGSQAQAEAFDFDPNTATAADLQRLGLSPRLVSNILKYREKGGQFRDREDFRKLYGLSDQDYARLEPYIFLPLASSGPAPRPVAYAAGNGNTRYSQAPLSLDINSAGLEDWQRLPGIGNWRAQQILHFRDLLGGFASVGQVAETRDLPDSVFQKIQPLLLLKSPVFRPISLNTASADELDAHCYISRKQADLIVNYRNQHGPFTSVDDLKKIEVFRDGVWLEKIRPYLSVE